MKFYSVLLLVLTGVLLAGCADKSIIAEDMLRMNHEVHKEDFYVDEVQSTIWESIAKEYEVAEDYKEYLEVMSLTTDSLWENAKTQVFYTYIPIPMMTFDGFAVYNESDELIELIAGVGAREVFSADLNGDDSYEIIINYERGVEITSRNVVVYDIKNDAIYKLDKEDEKIDMMAHLDDEENRIVIYSKMTTADIDTEKYYGTLELEEDGLIINK